LTEGKADSLHHVFDEVTVSVIHSVGVTSTGRAETYDSSKVSMFIAPYYEHISKASDMHGHLVIAFSYY